MYNSENFKKEIAKCLINGICDNETVIDHIVQDMNVIKYDQYYKISITDRITIITFTIIINKEFNKCIFINGTPKEVEKNLHKLFIDNKLFN